MPVALEGVTRGLKEGLVKPMCHWWFSTKKSRGDHLPGSDLRAVVNRFC
jgi:hypothetical protein